MCQLVACSYAFAMRHSIGLLNRPPANWMLYAHGAIMGFAGGLIHLAIFNRADLLGFLGMGG